MSATLLEMMTKLERKMAPVRVIAVGGCGLSILDILNAEKLYNFESIAIDTDNCRLAETNSDQRLLLGETLTEGYGTGGDELLGARSLNGKHVDVRDLLLDSKVNIFVGGLGGGTATALLPELSRISRSLGVLTLVVATKPFKYEGFQKTTLAKRKLHSLFRSADSVFVINNDTVVRDIATVSAKEALVKSDSAIQETVNGLLEFFTPEKRVLLDFGTIKSHLTRGGLSSFCSGESALRNNAIEAFKAALEQFARRRNDITKAPRALIQFSIDADVLMDGVKNAFGVAQRVFNKDAQLSMGVVFNKHKQGITRVSIIASGLPLFNEVVDTDINLTAYRGLEVTKRPLRGSAKNSLRSKKFSSVPVNEEIRQRIAPDGFNFSDLGDVKILNPQVLNDDELRVPAYLRRRSLKEN